MRVARLYGVRDLRLTDEPRPADLPPGHSLVRVTAVGLCGSDLHWFAEGGIGDAVLDAPLVLGHEFAGIAEAGPHAGRRVAVDPAISCGTCESCLEGNRNLCPTVRFAGHGRQDGGLREWLAWPSHLLHPLPDEISDAGGAVLEPLGVALHTLDLGHLRAGTTAAVVGCGPIGLLLVELVRAAGAATVVAVEPLEHRRRIALERGADAALTPAEAHAGGLLDVTGGRGVDVAFEVAGTDDAVDLAMRAARPGARVVLAGIPDDDRMSFSASLARRKGLSIIMVRRMKDVYPRAIALARRGTVSLELLVTDRFELVDAADAFDSAVRRTSLKTVIQMQGGDPC